MRPKQAKVAEMTLKYETSVAEVRTKQEEVKVIKESIKKMEEDL